MTLTFEEEQLALTLNFDENVLRLVKSELQKPLEPFYSEESPKDKGFIVVLDEAYTGFWKPDFIALVHRIRSLLLPYGYMAFLMGWPYPRPCLVILKTFDQNEIIRVVNTHGWDLDDKSWQAEELIAKMADWQQLCDFKIIGADYNNIKLEFRTLPQDMIAFAEDVNHLCWELDQVYGIELYSGDAVEKRQATEQLAQIISETQRLYPVVGLRPMTWRACGLTMRCSRRHRCRWLSVLIVLCRRCRG